jgi:RimJ/RimL family protein N-acetyltransferase
MLEGKLVRLRAPERGDLPVFVRWINDPEVTEFLQFEPPMSIEDEEIWFQHMVQSKDRTFAIETKDGRLIGNIGLMGLDLRNRKTEVGIMIGEKDMWSQGYGTDAMLILLRYLFEEMNINRVGLYADVSNHRALRSYEKCGFSREGVVRQYRFKDGRYLDSVLMSMLQQDWAPRKEAESSEEGGGPC